MQLDEALVLERIESWTAPLAVPWTGAQKNRLVALLTELGSAVEPYLVMDIPLPAARRQQYVWGRVLGRIEDWLTVAAASHRRVIPPDALRHSAAGALSLGLRSANRSEMEALPGIGGALADDIGRYLARRGEVEDLAALAEVDGIGSERLADLQRVAHLEDTAVGFASPSLWAFLMSPTVPNVLALLEKSDLSLVWGDHNAILRRISAAGPSVFERFLALIEVVTRTSVHLSTPTGGSVASEADRWLQRRQLRAERLAAAEPSSGALLSNDAYVEATKAVIDNAQASVYLMVFLGTTAAASDGSSHGPLTLVESMEAAATRGLDVRVILDQDDAGVPYRSAFINKPLVDRFRENGVSVKLDDKDTLLHSKILVADSATTIVGSHNWTRAGFTKTHELSVLLESEAIAGAFAHRFEAVWTGLPALR